jgi:hypothetical protein
MLTSTAPPLVDADEREQEEHGDAEHGYSPETFANAISSQRSRSGDF